MNSSSEESFFHTQPNPSVELKQDQSCQKNLKIFGRIFQNFEKKTHIWCVSHCWHSNPSETQFTASGSLLFVALVWVYLPWCSQWPAFQNKPFLLGEPCPFGGPQSPTEGFQPVQPNKGLRSPAPPARSRALTLPTKEKLYKPQPTLWDTSACLGTGWTSGHPKAGTALLCHGTSPDLQQGPCHDARAPQWAAATRTRQPSPDPTDVFPDMLYPHSQNKNHVQRWTAPFSSWQAVTYLVRHLATCLALCHSLLWQSQVPESIIPQCPSPTSTPSLLVSVIGAKHHLGSPELS